tara:strand:- start:3675 stop:4337 length:663 start_codon:yes stop_codon:yes gene_type:complete
MKILFFGYKECPYSSDACNYLKQLDCEVTSIFSNSRKDKIPEEIFSWEGDYIISFLNYLILPPRLINKARYAINFHPASPEHPGSGVSNWAIYNGSTEYGATAHLINEKVDNGQILLVKRFNITSTDDATTLLIRAKHYCMILFYELIEKLFIKNVTVDSLIKSNCEEWLGKAKKIKEVDKMSEIPTDIDSQELEKRIKAFHTKKFPIYTLLHGRKFIYV